MKELVVLSGNGGTGKTTLVAAFASLAKDKVLCDADVDAADPDAGRQVTLIRRQGRKLAEAEGFDLLLTDGPSGTGTPVVASIRGATTVLIVAEPTAAGMHDMERIADLASFLKVPAMVCVNKFDLNPEQERAIERFAQERNMSVAGHIPFDPAFTEATLAGKTIIELAKDSPARRAVLRVWRRIVLELEFLYGNPVRAWFSGGMCFRLGSVGIEMNE